MKRVDTEERQSSVLSPSPSLFPTIIFDIVCYFCGIFITKSGGCSRFSGRPSLLCSAVQTASVRVDTPLKCIFSRLGMHACLSASTDVSIFSME